MFCVIVCAEILCVFTHYHTKFLPRGKLETDAALSLDRDVINVTFTISWCLSCFSQNVFNKLDF